MTARVPLGLSMSVLKTKYRKRSAESVRKHVTPFAYCFQALFNQVLNDVRVGKSANTDGVAFIIETGNQHNGDAERSFNAVRKKYALQNVLRSTSFVGKDDSRAIQMADLLAFYSRRQSRSMEQLGTPPHNRPEYWTDPMMNIISASVPVRAFVATDFHEREQSA
jgi:hypothetical protein